MLLKVKMKTTWLPIALNICRLLRLDISLNIKAKNNKTVVHNKENMKYEDEFRLARKTLRVMIV